MHTCTHAHIPQAAARIIGITTSIRAEFLRACFPALEEPRHSVSIRVEVNGVRQPEAFSGASISHNRWARVGGGGAAWWRAARERERG